MSTSNARVRAALHVQLAWLYNGCRFSLSLSVSAVCILDIPFSSTSTLSLFRVVCIQVQVRPLPHSFVFCFVLLAIGSRLNTRPDLLSLLGTKEKKKEEKRRSFDRSIILYTVLPVVCPTHHITLPFEISRWCWPRAVIVYYHSFIFIYTPPE